MSCSSTSSNCFCYCDNKIYFLFTHMQEVCHNSLLHKHSHNNNTDCVWQCECHEFKCAVTDWLTLIWLLVSLCWTVRINKKKKSLHLEHKEFNTQREAGVLNRLLVFVDIFSLCSFDVQEHQSSFYTWTLDNNEIIRSGYFQLLSSLSCSTEQEVVHSEDILCVV